jgi:hypothetical protein
MAATIVALSELSETSEISEALSRMTTWPPAIHGTDVPVEEVAVGMEITLRPRTEPGGRC